MSSSNVMARAMFQEIKAAGEDPQAVAEILRIRLGAQRSQALDGLAEYLARTSAGFIPVIDVMF